MDEWGRYPKAWVPAFLLPVEAHESVREERGPTTPITFDRKGGDSYETSHQFDCGNGSHTIFSIGFSTNGIPGRRASPD